MTDAEVVTHDYPEGKRDDDDAFDLELSALHDQHQHHQQHRYTQQAYKREVMLILTP